MTDWKQGGWTGSLNAWVQREINEHFRQNGSARRSRYSRITRLVHRIFDGGTFGWFIAIYMVLGLVVAVAEFVLAAYWPNSLPRWTGAPDIKLQLTNVASYLITAQVGALGVVSIAIGLVTIIAQRENASSDVKVYYHESLAFGIVASSIALLAVLCAQLLWPAQFALHWFGFGTRLQLFKLALTAVHSGWLLLNLGGLARFVAITLAFVQQTYREGLRERYTTNVVLPIEMRKRLREQLYLGAGPEFVKEFFQAENEEWRDPVVYLGADFGDADVEISLNSSKRNVLGDVRMAWVQWAVGRWLRRCRAATSDKESRTGGPTEEPLLLFPPRLDEMAEIGPGLCRRRGGVPLARRERLVLRAAFKFRRKRDEA